MSYENFNFPIPPRDDPRPLYKKFRRALYIYVFVVLIVPSILQIQHITVPLWANVAYTVVFFGPLSLYMPALRSKDLLRFVGFLVAYSAIVAVITYLLK